VTERLARTLFLLCAISLWPKTTIAGSVPELVSKAREQIGVTVEYDPSYRSLGYPGGDVPLSAGVCTDVLIRALRRSDGIDLQQAVHEDMKQNFQAYPRLWGLRRPDPHIDHRRVPNLQTFFRRRGYSIEGAIDPKKFTSGDIVTMTIPPNLPHIAIVSDRKNVAGIPYIIHNIGAGTREEDRLEEFPITGHYRIPNLKTNSNK
jgi:uncharacterized protein YijF (DUF1287 family)